MTFTKRRRGRVSVKTSSRIIRNLEGGDMRHALRDHARVLSGHHARSSLVVSPDADDGWPKHRSPAPIGEGQYLRYVSPGIQQWVNVDHDLARKPQAGLFLNHLGSDLILLRVVPGLPASYTQTNEETVLIASYSPVDFPVLLMLW